MLFPENYPADPDDLLFIEMAPLSLPVFTLGIPPFANEQLIRGHRMASIDVTPVVYERRTPEWYDGARDEDPVHEVLFFFDPDEFPVSEYGLIFQDKAFEAHAARQLDRVLPGKRFGGAEFTSLNEQGDDYVSMRYPLGSGRAFSREIRKDPGFFSNLSASPHITKITLITPLTAERYRQAIEPRRPEDNRPSLPKGLFAGMWITWPG